jgi:hypothetical protein
MLDSCLGDDPVQFRVGKFPYAIVGTHSLDLSTKLVLNIILEFPDSSTASYFVFRLKEPNPYVPRVVIHEDQKVTVTRRKSLIAATQIAINKIQRSFRPFLRFL